MLLALDPKPVALAAEGLDVLARLLLCLLELLLEAGMLITMRPLDLVEGPTKLLDLAAEPIAFGRCCSRSARSRSPSPRRTSTS